MHQNKVRVIFADVVARFTNYFKIANHRVLSFAVSMKSLLDMPAVYS